MKQIFYCVIADGLCTKYGDFETAKKEANKLVKKGYNAVIADRLYDNSKHIGTYCEYVKGTNGRWYENPSTKTTKDAYVGMPVEMAVTAISEDGRWGKEVAAYGKIEEIDNCGHLYVRTDDGRLIMDGRNEDCYMEFTSNYMTKPREYSLYVKEWYESNKHVYRNRDNKKSYFTRDAALKDLEALKSGYDVMAKVNTYTNVNITISPLEYKEGFEYEEYNRDCESMKTVKAWVC